MNSAALTEFLHVVAKRLEDELNEPNHKSAVRASLDFVIAACKDAAKVTSAAILPQEQKPPEEPEPEPEKPATE